MAGKDKLRRFAAVKEFDNFYEPVLKEPFDMKGNWKAKHFKNDNPIVLELGCGKGEYSVGLAKHFKDKNFIGLNHNDTIPLGKNMIISLFTPGHYKDSMCYWVQDEDIVFTGDTIFVGRSGRTISNGSNIFDLYNSIYNIILKLPLNTVICSGHHYGFSKTITIKDNIRYSDFFTCRTVDEFILIMQNFEDNRHK